MDKVIIDGVNVSECDNLAILQDRMTDKEFTFCNAYQEDCSERENCHYKQLKRLQAENEILKEKLQISQNSDKKTIEIIKENERLKARLRPLEDSYFNGLSSIEIAELAKKSIRITAENRKLEDALQEIREYCEEQNLKADYTACEIIDKINEVIGAEE